MLNPFESFRKENHDLFCDCLILLFDEFDALVLAQVTTHNGHIYQSKLHT